MVVCMEIGCSCSHTKSSPVSFPENLAEASPNAYREIRDAADWKNPYLVIRPNGVEILHVSPLVEPTNLKTTLSSLPYTAWPYGKIVAVQELGIRSGDDDQKIKEVLAEVLSILQKMNIEISRWPSA